MKNNFRFIITLLVIISSIYGCKNQDKKSSNNNIRLESVYLSKNISRPASIEIDKKNDLIKIITSFSKQNQKHVRVNKFILKNGSYYEEKRINNLENEIVNTQYILAFGKVDTSFIYEYNSEKYPLPKGLEDWKYNISKLDKNEYLLKKQNTIDSTFLCEYFFDDDYNFKKINIYEGSDTLKFE